MRALQKRLPPSTGAARESGHGPPAVRPKSESVGAELCRHRARSPQGARALFCYSCARDQARNSRLGSPDPSHSLAVRPLRGVLLVERRAAAHVRGGDAVESGKFLDGVHSRSGLQLKAAYAQRRITVREQHAGAKRNRAGLAGGQPLAEIAGAPARRVEHHLPHCIRLRRRQAEIDGRVAGVA